jgi:hypothetical protein
MKSKPPGLGPIFKYADEAQSDHVRPSKGTNSAAPNLVARKKGGQPQWGASESLHRAPVWTTLRSFCTLQATVTAWFPPGWIGEPTCRGFILFEEEDCDGEQIAVTFYDACMYGDHEIRLEDVVALEPEQTGFGCELCEIVQLYEVADDDAPKRMTVRWFWRPGALQEHRVEAKDDREQEGDDSSDDEIDVSPVEAGRHEIFRTECKDTHNSIDSIERYVAHCTTHPHPAQVEFGLRGLGRLRSSLQSQRTTPRLYFGIRAPTSRVRSRSSMSLLAVVMIVQLHHLQRLEPLQQRKLRRARQLLSKPRRQRQRVRKLSA